MQLTKVISTKTMFGDKAAIQELVLADKKNAIYLYRVGGECTGLVKGNTSFAGQEKQSEWTKLVGDFRAIDHDGGEWESPIAFLPGYVVPAIEAQFGAGVVSVTFVYDIYAQYDARSATSYVFLARQLSANPEESLASKMFAALPKPEKQKRIGQSKSKE